MKPNTIAKLVIVISLISGAALAQPAAAGRDWSVTYLRGAKIGTVEAHIDIDANGEKFSGNTGCNVMSGLVTIDRGRIRFNAIITTKRACTRQTAPIESALLNALNAASSYKLANERLRLYSGKTLVAELGPRSAKVDTDMPLNATDQLRLEDKKWLLESISGSAIPKVEQEAFIVFDPVKRSAGGDTSCNAFGSEYAVDGERIRITQIISTMRACIEDERMNIQRGFLDGLRAADRFEIIADKLKLYRRDKLLLTFEGRKK